MPNHFARHLRKHQTDAERKLWRELRNLKHSGFHFRRQAPIGPYVADFICYALKLVIEIDGGQHNETEGITSDERRTAWLETQGYQVLRFWNNDVISNLDGVHTTIRATLGLDSPPPETLTRFDLPARGR